MKEEKLWMLCPHLLKELNQLNLREYGRVTLLHTAFLLITLSLTKIMSTTSKQYSTYISEKLQHFSYGGSQGFMVKVDKVTSEDI